MKGDFDLTVEEWDGVPCLGPLTKEVVKPKDSVHHETYTAKGLELDKPLPGRKYDGGKARLELLPPELLLGVGEVLRFGAGKYDDRNWEQGMKWSRVFGALMRHMWKWWGGEENDPETGMSHLWHAGCNIAFLIAYEERGVGEDDRSF